MYEKNMINLYSTLTHNNKYYINNYMTSKPGPIKIKYDSLFCLLKKLSLKILLYCKKIYFIYCTVHTYQKMSLNFDYIP